MVAPYAPPNAPRWYVRVGGDVRGPVDEPTIVQWLAQGMRGAEVCLEGGAAFMPIEHTPLARYLGASRPSPSRWSARSTTGAGVGTAIVIAMFVMLGRGARVCNGHLRQTEAELRASLPAVGAHGELHRTDGVLSLCRAPADPALANLMSWPCGKRDGVVVEEGSHVEVMKTEARGTSATCRYWVQGGPNDRFVGDAPCAWLRIIDPR